MARFGLKDAFPDFDPEWLPKPFPDFLKDVCWSNDFCPTFQDKISMMLLCVDYPEDDQREEHLRGVPRFTIYDGIRYVDLLDTNDWNEVLKLLSEMQK